MVRALFVSVLLFSATAVKADISWEKYESALGENTRGIDAADFDGDGNLDILATGYVNVFIVLNPMENQRAQVLWDTGGGALLYAASGDMDKDGDLDFVVARGISPWTEYREKRARDEKARKPKGVEDFSIAWIENNGELGRKLNWHPVDLDLHGCHGMAIGDLNRDGLLDVVGNSFQGDFKDSVAWFENFEGKFVRHMIASGTAAVRPHYMDIGDLDYDGKPDVVVGHSRGNELSWYKNPPSLYRKWTENLIGEQEGVTNAKIADIDGDGRWDVVSSNGHGTGVHWYKGPYWNLNTIDGAISDCHALDVGDFDSDGDLDVATASFTQKVVRWYENRGDGRFRGYDIDVGTGQEAYDLKAVDLNKDDRLDILWPAANPATPSGTSTGGRLRRQLGIERE